MKMFLAIFVIIIGLITFAFGILLLTERPKGKTLSQGNFEVQTMLYQDDPERIWIELFTRNKGIGIAVNDDMTVVATMDIDKSHINDRVVELLNNDHDIHAKVSLLKYLKKKIPHDGGIYRMSVVMENSDDMWDDVEDLPVLIERGTPVSTSLHGETTMQWEKVIFEAEK